MSTFVHRSDTNAATIAVTLHQISVNPEIEAKVRAELREVSAFYSGVTLNAARPDMNNYATLGVMLY
jgi:hypothetical protein